MTGSSNNLYQGVSKLCPMGQIQLTHYYYIGTALESEKVTQSYLTLCDPINCTVHRIWNSVG